MTIYDLPTPVLLLDIDVLERNLSHMQERANDLNVTLRPHIKTHKCLEIAHRQLDMGARGITVSTYYEAEQFARAGFNDITWAFPLPPLYAEKVARLNEHACIRVVVDSFEAKEAIEQAASRITDRMHVWLKVDCGYHRAGVDPESPFAEELLAALCESKSIMFEGILSHSGYAYNARRRAEIINFANRERLVMVSFAERMRRQGYRIPLISIGSTPAMMVIEDLEGINEVRPGNYAFNDYTQTMIGSCGVSDCALTVLASIVSHQPGASYFITDAGALALSKDLGPTHVKNDMDMGSIFEDYKRKRLAPHIQLRTLSQEHGKVVTENPAVIEGRYKVGERLRILEHHSCLTAANFDYYYVVKEDEVMEKWKILRGRS
ncbi:MAG: alanine racemase [bacterium]